MKKIIWIFGEVGSGKKTFINNILSDEWLREYLNIWTNKLRTCIYGSTNIRRAVNDYYNYSKRDNFISNSLKEFEESDDEAIIILGKISDITSGQNNIISKVESMYPKYEKIVYLLDVPDHDILYERVMDTDWFQSDYEKNIKIFPRVWLDIAVEYLTKEVYKCKKYGYNLIEIDTTNGYIIENEEYHKTM